MDNYILADARFLNPFGILNVSSQEDALQVDGRSSAITGDLMSEVQKFPQDISSKGSASAGYQNLHRIFTQSGMRIALPKSSLVRAKNTTRTS